MTDSIQFVFSKQRLILVLVCSVLIALLLFAAGVATGFLLHPVPVELPGQLTSSSRARPPTTSNPIKSAVPPASASAPISTSDAAENSESGLIVDVGSFSEKEKAADLASMLKREGFGPIHTGEYQSQGETLYYVHAGPFHTWEDASGTATELNQSFDVHASVMPVKGGP